MSLSTMLFAIICVFLWGCNSSNYTGPDPGEPNTTNPRTSSPTGSNIEDAVSEPATNVTSQSSDQAMPPVVVPPIVLDAEDTALPVGVSMECSGLFLDRDNFKLNRVSIEVFDMGEGDSMQVPVRLTLGCSFSVLSYTTQYLTPSLPSCRDIQRAIATARVCDSRGSIGGAAEFVGRLQHLFLMPEAGDATNGVLGTSTEGICPMLVGPSTVAAIRVPRRTPTGMHSPIYEIYFEFNSSLELYEFYHAENAADILCPVGLNTVNIRETQNRLAGTMISIMNSITDSLTSLNNSGKFL